MQSSNNQAQTDGMFSKKLLLPVQLKTSTLEGVSQKLQKFSDLKCCFYVDKRPKHRRKNCVCQNMCILVDKVYRGADTRGKNEWKRETRGTKWWKRRECARKVEFWEFINKMSSHLSNILRRFFSSFFCGWERRCWSKTAGRPNQSSPDADR